MGINLCQNGSNASRPVGRISVRATSAAMIPYARQVNHSKIGLLASIRCLIMTAAKRHTYVAKTADKKKIQADVSAIALLTVPWGWKPATQQIG